MLIDVRQIAGTGTSENNYAGGTDRSNVSLATLKFYKKNKDTSIRDPPSTYCRTFKYIKCRMHAPDATNPPVTHRRKVMCLHGMNVLTSSLRF